MMTPVGYSVTLFLPGPSLNEAHDVGMSHIGAATSIHNHRYPPVDPPYLRGALLVCKKPTCQKTEALGARFGGFFALAAGHPKNPALRRKGAGEAVAESGQVRRDRPGEAWRPRPPEG